MLIKHTLSDKYLFRLGNIFKKNAWDIGDYYDGEISIFDRFCLRLDELECDEDRDFILDLTENYLFLRLEKYEQHIIEVFRKFIKEENNVIGKIDIIHIFPIQDKEYFEKTKSGNVICYLMQGVLCRRFSEFHNKRIRIIETYEGIKKHKEEIELLILVDDYIGTGDTVLACLNLLEENGVEKEKLRVVSLVSQIVGKQAVKDYGVNAYISIERNKGISDCYPAEEVEKKLEQMKKISKKIKANKELYLGYNDSEGLITTIKTPNNTFPFYWYERKNKNSYTYAPFPRRGNIGVEE